MHPCQVFISERETQETEGKQGKEVHQAWGQDLGGKENEKGSEEEEEAALRRTTRIWKHECFGFRWRI